VTNFVIVLTGTTADTSGDTTIQAGSLLDDGQWHDVEVTRKEQDLALTVDRLTMTNVTNGDFYQLDLDRKVIYRYSVRRVTSFGASHHDRVAGEGRCVAPAPRPRRTACLQSSTGEVFEYRRS